MGPPVAGVPSRVFIERQGLLATSRVFGYDDWPQGAHSRVRIECVRTKSWIRGSWRIHGGAESVSSIGAELNLQPEALLDFGAGDLVTSHFCWGHDLRGARCDRRMFRPRAPYRGQQHYQRHSPAVRRSSVRPSSRAATSALATRSMRSSITAASTQW